MGKRTTLLTPYERASATASSRPWRQPRRATPGMEAMGTSCSPSWTNTGRMRLLGERCVSEMAPRIVGLLLLRRGLDAMSCPQKKSLVLHPHGAALGWLSVLLQLVCFMYSSHHYCSE